MVEEETRIRIVRPTYPPYKPTEIKGNMALYRFFLLTFITLLVMFNIYLWFSFLELLHQGLSTSAFLLNLYIFAVGGFTTNFAIMVLWNFGRRFLPLPKPIGYRGRYWKKDSEDLPFASIVIPTYRESPKILRRTILASLDLNYPEDKLEVVVLEDMAETTVIRELCSALNVRYIHRDHRRGFKAGAINDCLPKLRGEVVLFIDADHLLERSVILNSMNYWQENTIAVQMRVDYVNMHTFLTYTAAFLQMQFFSYYQLARRATGSAIFAGGTALFDKELLIKNGGMNELTIADDTDTTYILVARGYRIEYLDMIGGWGLIPWDPVSLVRQVWRWLSGTTRSFRARIIYILKGKSPLFAKIDHATNSFFPVLGVLAYFISYSFLGLYLLNEPFVSSTVGVGGVPLASILYPVIGILPMLSGYVVLILENPEILYTKKPFITKIVYLSAFYMFIYTVQPLLIIGTIKGLLGTSVEFNRTPKDRIHNDHNKGGILSHKDRYALYTIVLLIISVVLLWTVYPFDLSDPRVIVILFLAINSFVPFIFAIFWYWRIDKYLEKVGDVSTDMVLREELYTKHKHN